MLLYQAGHRISIHAPTRGATIKRAISMPNLKFQSTLPRGERLYVWVAGHTIAYFNPRSHEGSDYIRRAGNHIRCNFNPRSHEGSDGCSDIADQVDYISIHAPTRGATALIAIGVALYKFQSTLPRGERHFVLLITHTFIYISIHAPTRGATFSTENLVFRGFYFNPRSHEGSDGSQKVSNNLFCLFQSTLPRGERHSGQTKAMLNG